MSKKPFLQKLLDSVANEVAAGKAPTVAEAKAEVTVPAPVVEPPRVIEPVDPLAEVREHMQAIQAAHAQAEREARQAYLELLRRYAPARPAGAPAPAPDAHALAAPPTAPVPPMSEVLAVLSAAKKSPDDLTRDLKTWSSACSGSQRPDAAILVGIWLRN
jgi:hypothetical protein